MNVVHRGVIDDEIHPGFVDECVECTPKSPFFGDEPNEPELGSPAPWWHRLWCRFVTWWFGGKGKS